MSAPAPGQVAPTSTGSMYRAIVGIALICALLIVTVVQATAQRIRDNRDRAMRQAIATVLPQARRIVAVQMNAEGGLAAMDQPDSELPVFVGYDDSGRLTGATVTASGMGYQDIIRVIYAYSFADQAIVGFRVLESKETPGLGDRIETAPHFLASFHRLDVSLDATGRGLSHPIVATAEGDRSRPWQIDGITGATISSVAVARILNDSAQTWIPALARDAPTLDTTP